MWHYEIIVYKKHGCSYEYKLPSSNSDQCYRMFFFFYYALRKDMNLTS